MDDLEEEINYPEGEDEEGLDTGDEFENDEPGLDELDI